MRVASMVPWAGLLAVAAACGGGSDTGGGVGGPAQNAFTGTITISSASSAMTCASTKTVNFTAGGADVHTVTAAGGDCVQFVNQDAANHQPAQNGSGCPELNGPSLAHNATFTTPPLSGPKTCNWMDALNPPTGGGY